VDHIAPECHLFLPLGVDHFAPESVDHIGPESVVQYDRNIQSDKHFKAVGKPQNQTKTTTKKPNPKTKYKAPKQNTKRKATQTTKRKK